MRSRVLPLAVLSVAGLAPAILADGTETLGPPSIAISSGSGVAAAGVGLVAGQPASIITNVPLGSTVKQVLLYWSGEFTQSDPADMGDDTVLVNGNPVTGIRIGGPTLFFGSTYVSAWRADITSLGAVSTGMSNVEIDGVDYNQSNNGAGIYVIYEVPGSTSNIQIVDGSDLAFVNFAPPLDTTVTQTLNFPASTSARNANLCLFAASVGNGRPNVIEVNVGANQMFFDNVLASVDGDLWDTVELMIPIPAGETSLSVQVRSEDRLNIGVLEASLTWIGASLSLPEDAPPPPGDGCSRTLGYWKTHGINGPAGPRDDTWDLLPNAEDTLFFDTGVSYMDMLWTKPRGSAYVILAHQYIAAVLNGLAGADTTVIDTELMEARDLLDLYDGNPLNEGDIDKVVRGMFTSLAGTLDDYNNGIIGPGHCDD